MAIIAFPKFPFYYYAYGIIKDAPHPSAAWLFLDYLTSPQGQFEYTDVISALLPLNKRAQAGKLAKWMVEQGVTLEMGDVSDPSTASRIFNEDTLKKSENFYQKLLGIK